MTTLLLHLFKCFRLLWKTDDATFETPPREVYASDSIKIRKPGVQCTPVVPLGIPKGIWINGREMLKFSRWEGLGPHGGKAVTAVPSRSLHRGGVRRAHTPHNDLIPARLWPWIPRGTHGSVREWADAFDKCIRQREQR